MLHNLKKIIKKLEEDLKESRKGFEHEREQLIQKHKKAVEDYEDQISKLK